MDVDAEGWIEIRVEPIDADTFRQDYRGRPGANTRYRKITTPNDARMDGVFPLITNDKTMSRPLLEQHRGDELTPFELAVMPFEFRLYL